MSMIRSCKKILLISLLFGAVSTVSAGEQLDGQQLFKKKCSLCHALDKKKLGPPIQSMSKEREVLIQVITNGKNSMPGYEGKLTGMEIGVLADYLLKNQ